MHREVLQNEDYIEFAFENTVEVMAFQNLDLGIADKDAKAATYKTKDANGKDVEYLVEFPNLTVAEIKALHSSKAGSYNDSKGIPYTSLVDPHTQKKMRGYSNKQTVKRMMEIVTDAKAQLQEKYGPSLSRKNLEKFDDEVKVVRAALKKSGAAKALAAFKKVEKLVKKQGPKMKARAAKVKEELLKSASEELDKAEELIEDGDTKAAMKLLTGLKRALKKTPLEKRTLTLIAKAKPAAK